MKKVTNKDADRRANMGPLMNIEKHKTALLDLKQSLLQAQETGDQAEQTVELDQARVGRLSRMDAMQAQAMSKETGRRRRQKPHCGGWKTMITAIARNAGTKSRRPGWRLIRRYCYASGAPRPAKPVNKTQLNISRNLSRCVVARSRDRSWSSSVFSPRHSISSPGSSSRNLLGSQLTFSP